MNKKKSSLGNPTAETVPGGVREKSKMMQKQADIGVQGADQKSKTAKLLETSYHYQGWVTVDWALRLYFLPSYIPL